MSKTLLSSLISNVSNSKLLFLVKERAVSTSMKSASYQIYVHLNQVNGEVEYAKCCCKAGQGGCCKHVAALLYTILDFTNLNLQNIPVELTCTGAASPEVECSCLELQDFE